MPKVYLPPTYFMFRNMKLVDFLFAVGLCFGVSFNLLGFIISLDANGDKSLIELANISFLLGILLLILACITGFIIFLRNRKRKS